MDKLSQSLSNNQIDKLGERLKAGHPSDEDVVFLSAYRNSFYDSAKSVADKVRVISGLVVTTRALKTTLSIVAKLKRDGIKKLSAMQDIGGCRVTVSNLTEQNELTQKLPLAFPDAKLYDRVASPSHGYRAKHLVVKVNGRRIEIQIRTRLQNQWALISESVADLWGQEIKYGLGSPSVNRLLMHLSSTYFDIDQENPSKSHVDELESKIKEILIAFQNTNQGQNDLLH
jgi:ppGpp synthetase/RelA/SpoT-type nucleotidyltranferase